MSRKYDEVYLTRLGQTTNPVLAKAVAEVRAEMEAQASAELLAEVERLRATVQRVEKLATLWANIASAYSRYDFRDKAIEARERAADLAAALAGPAQTPQEAAEPATDTRPAPAGATAAAQGRHAACVARWPEAENGAYDPRCCRFPKSCSATIAAQGADDGV